MHGITVNYSVYFLKQRLFWFPLEALNEIKILELQFPWMEISPPGVRGKVILISANFILFKEFQKIKFVPCRIFIKLSYNFRLEIDRAKDLLLRRFSRFLLCQIFDPKIRLFLSSGTVFGKLIVTFYNGLKVLKRHLIFRSNEVSILIRAEVVGYKYMGVPPHKF